MLDMTMGVRSSEGLAGAAEELGRQGEDLRTPPPCRTEAAPVELQSAKRWCNILFEER